MRNCAPRLYLAVSIAMLLLVHAPAAAQTTLGRLAGTVLDSSGAVLPGATITLTNQGTGQVQTTVSNDAGVFLFPQVPVGTYKVEVSLAGFKSGIFTDVAIAVGQEYGLTAKLAVGSVSEVVTVESGMSLVPTTTPEVNTTVGQKQIEMLRLKQWHRLRAAAHGRDFIPNALQRALQIFAHRRIVFGQEDSRHSASMLRSIAFCQKRIMLSRVAGSLSKS